MSIEWGKGHALEGTKPAPTPLRLTPRQLCEPELGPRCRAGRACGAPALRQRQQGSATPGGRRPATAPPTDRTTGCTHGVRGGHKAGRAGDFAQEQRPVSEACPTSRAPPNSPVPGTARQEGRLRSAPRPAECAASQYRSALSSKRSQSPCMPATLGQSRANPIVQTLTETLLRPASAEWELATCFL